MTDPRATAQPQRGRLAFWALAGLALLVSHDAIYLAQVGPGQSLATLLRSAGHGYWGLASAALVAVALVAAVAAAFRIALLRRRAAAIGAQPMASPGLGRRFLRTWGRLAATVAIGFVLQENAEHLLAHGHAPGAGALLGPEHPLALPVISLVTAVAAAIATLIGGRHEALITAILAALRAGLRAPRRVLRPASRLVAAPTSVLAGRGAGRAPPSVLVATF